MKCLLELLSRRRERQDPHWREALHLFLLWKEIQSTQKNVLTIVLIVTKHSVFKNVLTIVLIVTKHSVFIQGPTPGKMPPKYDETTGKDAEDLFQKVGNIKLAWPDDDDIQFWIQQLETKMRFAGVKSQFLKLQVLTNVLPAKFMPPIKSMLKGNGR